MSGDGEACSSETIILEFVGQSDEAVPREMSILQNNVSLPGNNQQDEPASCNTSASNADGDKLPKTGTHPVPVVESIPPISLTDETVIIVDGTKCVLRLDKDSGKMMAFPLEIPSQSPKRKRGRPRKKEPTKPEERQTVLQECSSEKLLLAANELHVEVQVQSIVPRKRGRPRKGEEKNRSLVITSLGNGEADTENNECETERDVSAVEGLLELSNTGSGGIRRSGRKKQKPVRMFDDYTTLEKTSDFDATSSDDDTDNEKGALDTNGVSKRGARGRVLLQPESLNMSQSISAVIIDTSGGQATLILHRENSSATDSVSTSTETVEPIAAAHSVLASQLKAPQLTPSMRIGLKTKESDLVKLRCPQCDYQAYYPQQFQDHIATHTDTVYKCKCCSFVCFKDDELTGHFKESHPRCYCDECGYTAEHAFMIKRHKMRHSIEGCVCTICNKQYKDQYILKMHVKMVHMPAEVLYECNICTKKFTRKAHLKRHTRIHEPDKPFKCPTCEYRGCERSDVTKHLLIHEEPQHACDICSKSFRHIKNKDIHMKRHKGQRDYKCGVCEFYGYTFTDIRKHIERKHSDIRNVSMTSARPSEFLNVLPGIKDTEAGNDEFQMIDQTLGQPSSQDEVSEGVHISSSQITADGTQIIMSDGTRVNIVEECLSDEMSLTEEQLAQAQLSVSSSGHVISVSQSGVSIVTAGDRLVQDVYEEGVDISLDEASVETMEATTDGDVITTESDMIGMTE